MRIVEARASLRPDRPTSPLKNPFGEDTSMEDLSEWTVFSSKKAPVATEASNPFGEPDDCYDDKLNLFC